MIREYWHDDPGCKTNHDDTWCCFREIILTWCCFRDGRGGHSGAPPHTGHLDGTAGIIPRIVVSCFWEEEELLVEGSQVFQFRGIMQEFALADITRDTFFPVLRQPRSLSPSPPAVVYFCFSYLFPSPPAARISPSIRALHGRTCSSRRADTPRSSSTTGTVRVCAFPAIPQSNARSYRYPRADRNRVRTNTCTTAFS